jgi:hypothetical protein
VSIIFVPGSLPLFMTCPCALHCESATIKAYTLSFDNVYSIMCRHLQLIATVHLGVDLECHERQIAPFKALCFKGCLTSLTTNECICICTYIEREVPLH